MLLNTLLCAVHSPLSGGSEKEGVAQVELLPSGDFRKSCTFSLPSCVSVSVHCAVGVEACRRRLLSTSSLPGVKPEASPEERLVQVSSMLPLESVNVVRNV